MTCEMDFVILVKGEHRGALLGLACLTVGSCDRAVFRLQSWFAAFILSFL